MEKRNFRIVRGNNGKKQKFNPIISVYELDKNYTAIKDLSDAELSQLNKEVIEISERIKAIYLSRKIFVHIQAESKEAYRLTLLAIVREKETTIDQAIDIPREIFFIDNKIKFAEEIVKYLNEAIANYLNRKEFKASDLQGKVEAILAHNKQIRLLGNITLA